ncbi:hypothetical protein Ahy_A02g008528 isoform D [Arachis hypogaea]|uniref:Uncharacterized protein n=1 Tax=Arachis hypogaea TaxID=3818 RepID=A0A445EET2_ARAHY|nr:hypothetical protein Ahy_A02g008528 isoform D [Arachis hypogaea]
MSRTAIFLLLFALISFSFFSGAINLAVTPSPLFSPHPQFENNSFTDTLRGHHRHALVRKERNMIVDSTSFISCGAENNHLYRDFEFKL